MLMIYEAEPAIVDVGYRLINDDKTVDTALTSVGVTEIEPGCYGVDLDEDKVGKTIQWFEGAEYAVSERIPESVLPSLSLSTTIMGQGLGSVIFEDVVTSDGSKPVRNIVVRAFVQDGETVDWSNAVARHKTDKLGRYRLYLDPGTYVLSFEHDGYQLKTDSITVV